MAPIWMGLITFGCVTSGMVAGMSIRKRLPREHLGSETADTIKLATGMVATLAALVLGLLLAFAESSYRSKDDELTRLSSDLIRVHRLIHAYGPEAAKPEAMILEYAEQKRQSLFPLVRDRPVDPLDVPALDLLAGARDALLALRPASPDQVWLHQTALRLLDDIGEKRWLLVEQAGQRLPMPLLALLVFWLALIFTAFGLLSPNNPVAVGAHLFCAVAIAGAITMVLEMSDPFSGPVRLSEDVLRSAIAIMQR
jgi:hypothetical protein